MSEKSSFEHENSIAQSLVDPVGTFLSMYEKKSGAVASRELSVSVKTSTPGQRAETLWSLYQKLHKLKLLRHDAGGEAQEYEKTLQRVAAFYRDPETRAAYLDGFHRHTTERLTINGSYEQYTQAEREYEDAMAAHERAARVMFGKRGSPTDEDDRLDLQESEHVLREKRERISHLEHVKPEVAALVNFDTLRRYNKQLSRERYIWSPSRIKYLEKIEDAAMRGNPLLLAGESGTGKTELAKAAARKLTGREAGATPGKDVRLQDLIAKPKISPTGGTYYEYGTLGEAAIGKSNTLQTAQEHDGRVVLDDEFNLLDNAEQSTRLAAVASWKPGTRIRLPVTNEEITVAPRFLYIAMVNLASARYSRQKMEPQTLRKLAMIDIDYPEQFPNNPEIYDMMLAALLDEQGRMLAAESELSPQYTFAAETRTEKIHGLDMVRQVRARHFDSGADAGHGFLWRFAEAINQVNQSFSRKETVLKSRGEGQYVKDLIIDTGKVLGWLVSYPRFGRTRSLESYIAEQIHNEFTSKAAYTAADRTLVTDLFAHFGIDVSAARQEIPAPEFRVMTPVQVGRLSPSVAYYEVVREEVKLEMSVHITEDGERINYKKQIVDAGKFGRIEPGAIVSIGGGKFMEFLGVRTDNGELLMIEPQQIKNPEPSVPVAPNRPRDLFRGLIDVEAKKLGLERVELVGSAAAQDLMFRISTSALNISTPLGKKIFVDEWKLSCPNIPMPCVPPDDFWYLTELQAGNIIQNLDPKNKIIAPTHFGRSSVLWIDTWVEQDWNKDDKLKNAPSPLLRQLGMDSIVNISRETIDEALWEGDPFLRQKTPQHIRIIQKLGLDPAHYNFRNIAQDEYARLAPTRNLGQSNLLTWFNDYRVEGESMYGLSGGGRDNGGASNVDNNSLGNANENLAVRLVLECN